MTLPADGARSARADFARRVRAGEPLLGAILRMPAEMLVELSGHTGFDFVVIDAEHGPADQVALMHHLASAEAAGVVPLVRVGALDEVLRALDLGAAGIVFPHVDTVEQAEAVVAATRYPPRGSRGFATYSRAGRYGLTSGVEHLADHAGGPVVVVMVESEQGLTAAPLIARVPGVDALFLGPADYAAERGIVGEDPAPVQAALARVRSSGRTMSICSDADTVADHVAAGSQLVLVNVQHAVTQLMGRLGSSLPRAHPVAGTTASGADGTGRVPLVLLSGMLGDADLWSQVCPLLADVARPVPLRIDLDDSVAEMAATVLAMAPERFALAGHSLGGIVALEIIRQAPDRVTRLALLDTSGRSASEAQQHAWAELGERCDRGEFGQAATELAVATLPPARRGDADLVERNARMAWTVGEGGLRRQLAAQATRPDSLSSLTRVRVPTLVVSGAEDDVSPPPLQAELAAGVPGARHVVLEATGHMSPLESPDVVAQHLREWLRDA